MEVNPISMKRIYQSIIEQFVGLIKEGKLKVGQKLPPERTLAEMFNVSRASIREAFSAMDIIGLIEIRPGEGAFITNLNIAPFLNTIAPLFVIDQNMEDDLLDFRKMLEIEAVRLASEKAGEKEIALLEEPLAMMEKAIRQNDSKMGAEADIQFHRLLFVLSDNFIITKASECIDFLLETSVRFNRAKILRDNKNTKVLYRQHREIYKAILGKDGDLAAGIMKEHLDFVRQVL